MTHTLLYCEILNSIYQFVSFSTNYPLLAINKSFHDDKSLQNINTNSLPLCRNNPILNCSSNCFRAPRKRAAIPARHEISLRDEEEQNDPRIPPVKTVFINNGLAGYRWIAARR